MAWWIGWGDRLGCFYSFHLAPEIDIARILRSLALPEGGFLQFRYDLSIVDVKILEGTKSGQLLNRDALVCYVWTGAVGAPTEFVPCRLARVIGAEIVGSSFVVRFEVAGYVQLGEGIDFIALLSEEDREKTPKWEQDADTLKLKGLFAIALTARPNLNTSKKLDAFESIVKKLRSFCDFSREKGCQFFAVMGINSVMRGDISGLHTTALGVGRL